MDPAFALHFNGLDRSSATDEVHDDGDQGKDQEQVNQEAADVQHEEPAQPEQYQYNSKNEKHV
jgi:hypothetical protein